MNDEKPLLQVSNLSVSFGEVQAVRGVSYSLFKGRTLALVGASGSGKSVSSMALMGLLGGAAEIQAGQAIFESESRGTCDLLKLSDKELRGLRGKEIAMIFQDPMTALNPVYRCGDQVAEVLRLHKKLSKKQAKTAVVELFEQVQLPEPAKAYQKYPHQMSGGQKQRVMIAMAMSCEPDLLIADEPTTALDVTVQKEILELLAKLQQERGMGMLFITHDLGVVEDIADELVVMHAGQVVERGIAKEVIAQPEQAYTQGLIHSRPPLNAYPERLATVQDYLEGNTKTSAVLTAEHRRANAERLRSQEPLIEIHGLDLSFFDRGGLFSKPAEYKALRKVEFNIYPGETLGLVGGSGSGKTTLGRTILQLIKGNAGSVKYKGEELMTKSDGEMRELRKEIQIIFQDPYSSLNPRITIGGAMLEVMRVHGLGGDDTERRERIEKLLMRVGLQKEHYGRYPHEFSGGQRQRVVIARTLCVDPELIICDESVSALDVSVQAQVLNLLNELKEERGLTYVFISHDMAVVRYMSDRMIVLDKGEIKESGIADKIFSQPQSTAASILIDSIPGRS